MTKNNNENLANEENLERILEEKESNFKNQKKEKGGFNNNLIHNEVSIKKSTLTPKNDVVFQTLFSRGNERITKAFLEDILNIKIEKIELDKSKDLSNDNIKEKNGRLDVRAVLNGNVDCDIEMQVVSHRKLIERFLYYWSKMYTGTLEPGDDYDTLKKAISIIIIDEDIQKIKEVGLAHTEWHITEKHKAEVILTNYYEMHIISLPRAIREYEKNKKDEVLQWMMFLNNPENVEVSEIMEKNIDIKEAKETLDEISQDERLRREALNAEIARRDYNQGINDATQKGIEQGIKQGIELGEEKGSNKTKRKMIKQLALMNVDIKKIAKAADMTEDDVRKIIESEN